MTSAPDSILVLDLGTSRIKASLFSTRGAPITYTSAAYPTYSPSTGSAEQHPLDWWRAAGAACRALWESGQQPTAVRVIVTTGQMHGVVPIGADNTPLGPCLTLRDRRAAEYAAQINSALTPETIYAITGERLDAASLPAKMLWYRDHAPFYGQIAGYLAPKDWLRQGLTGGARVTDSIEAAGMVLYDVRGAAWSDEMIAAAAIRRDQLPDVCAPTDMAGMLLPNPASALGLPPGIPVVVGAADDIEFLGAGLLEPGDCLEHLGSTGSILLVVDHPVDDPTGTLELYPHLIPGRWMIGGSTSSAGAALDWMQRALQRSEPLRLPPLDLSQNGTHAPPLFVPYLAGERAPVWRPDTRATFWGVGMEHDQADLIRAVFEGVAFSLRHLFETLCSVGAPPAEINVVASSDAEWVRLRASLYERPLRLLPMFDPTALGAALIGTVALGIHADLQSAVRATATPAERIQASVRDGALHERYQRYLALSNHLRS